MQLFSYFYILILPTYKCPLFSTKGTKTFENFTIYSQKNTKFINCYQTSCNSFNVSVREQIQNSSLCSLHEYDARLYDELLLYYSSCVQQPKNMVTSIVHSTFTDCLDYYIGLQRSSGFVS